MTSTILQAINGVSLAALLFLLASGFTLSFGLMRVVNMAHGAYYLLGGYIGLSVARATGSFALALVAAGLRGGVGVRRRPLPSAAPARTISRRCCSRSASLRSATSR
jgi:branched-subunit amino acid ABC-type transport system permease component